MNDHSVRNAEENDITQLKRLYKEFHEFHVNKVPDYLKTPDTYEDPTLNDTLLSIISNPDSTIIVAYDGEDITGFAEAYVRDVEGEFVVKRRFVELQSLVVTESCRKTGIGSTLLEAVEQWARSKKADSIEVETWVPAEADRYYESKGYSTFHKRQGKYL